MRKIDYYQLNNGVLFIILFMVMIGASVAYIKWIDPILPKHKTPQRYVYACPDLNDSSKCYRVVADITDGRENDGWWFVDKIYFDNGGSVAFDDCTFEQGAKRGNCIQSNSDKEWFLEITDEKLKK